MVITITSKDLYPGLAEGPIQSTARVINAINGALVASIGSVVEVDPVSQGTPPGSLLPEVSAIISTGLPTYGIEVGGQRKGVYSDSVSTSNDIKTISNSPSFIAGFRERVRVCTQGVCLGNVISRNNSDVKIGDPLTADFFFDVPQDVLTTGFLAKAGTGDYVIARALQPVPAGTSEHFEIRTAAVDVQREGVLS